ncbi:MAG: hypothetical protein M1322_02430 [Candidatus Parvarchaeota archaeon]|jgi:peroxiredoxin family protein|nr:hypothetical protein [Candidatus Parvarchaeota archaeon]MCL5106947.1 hypothetical protein [Candidatus Parvarchaeota archaeon]
MEKVIIFVTGYSVDSLYSLEALVTGAMNTNVNAEVIFNGTSVLAMTKQFYGKFQKSDIENEYSKNIIEMWQAGEFPDVLSILEKAKKANKLKVYLCQPCVEVFEKKFGKLDFFDIVDKKLNGVELFTALKQEKDYTFLTV